LGSGFAAVDTSNLMDYLGLWNLLLLCEERLLPLVPTPTPTTTTTSASAHTKHNKTSSKAPAKTSSAKGSTAQAPPKLDTAGAKPTPSAATTATTATTTATTTPTTTQPFILTEQIMGVSSSLEAMLQETTPHDPAVSRSISRLLGLNLTALPEALQSPSASEKVVLARWQRHQPSVGDWDPVVARAAAAKRDRVEDVVMVLRLLNDALRVRHRERQARQDNRNSNSNSNSSGNGKKVKNKKKKKKNSTTTGADRISTSSLSNNNGGGSKALDADDFRRLESLWPQELDQVLEICRGTKRCNTALGAFDESGYVGMLAASVPHVTTPADDIVAEVRAFLDECESAASSSSSSTDAGDGSGKRDHEQRKALFLTELFKFMHALLVPQPIPPSLLQSQPNTGTC